MSSIQKICSLLNNKYSDNDIKLTLFYLANKKQNEFIDMLYYILEDDTPLFFELFGGQVLKIPTKSEFSRTNRNIKVFLFLAERTKLEDPFKLASYKFNLFLNRIAIIYIDCYELFIKDKDIENINLEIDDVDLSELEKLYIKAKGLEKAIIDDPSLNKRYIYSKRKNKKKTKTEQKEEIVDEINYNDLLGYEIEINNNDKEDDFEFIDTTCSSSENLEEDKQMSLF